MVPDPEHLGFWLHRMLPPALRGDFQDLPVWRRGVHEMLDLAEPVTVLRRMHDRGLWPGLKRER